MSLVRALRRERQVISEFEVNLIYRVSSMIARETLSQMKEPTKRLNFINSIILIHVRLIYSALGWGSRKMIRP